ncbi:Disulfide-bond oxidoreductase YfcG [Alphaproteobacteria bacterium SO-S41]|nr:Disulfide-bond oxidoreductase YfcG [Alphaproteobacteria bacterium SO-S41]
MIDVHYWPTPNGKKVTILLEELGIPYNVVPVAIGKGDQFTRDFLGISPNNRMPALVDHAPKGGGAPVNIFESGAIMLYLAEKEGRFLPADVHGKYEVTQWLIWQMANQGPKTGEAGHFRRLGDTQGDQTYAVTRFTDEVHRLNGVLNNRLYDRPFIAGEYSIADMISYPWIAALVAQKQPIDEFVHLKRWYDALSARPAVQRGMAVGADWVPANPHAPSPEEAERLRKLLYNQRARPVETEGRTAYTG